MSRSPIALSERSMIAGTRTFPIGAAPASSPLPVARSHPESMNQHKSVSRRDCSVAPPQVVNSRGSPTERLTAMGSRPHTTRHTSKQGPSRHQQPRGLRTGPILTALGDISRRPRGSLPRGQARRKGVAEELVRHEPPLTVNVSFVTPHWLPRSFPERKTADETTYMWTFGIAAQRWLHSVQGVG